VHSPDHVAALNLAGAAAWVAMSVWLFCTAGKATLWGPRGFTTNLNAAIGKVSSNAFWTICAIFSA